MKKKIEIGPQEQPTEGTLAKNSYLTQTKGLNNKQWNQSKPSNFTQENKTQKFPHRQSWKLANIL